jgi:hypothetical protein
MALQIRIPRSNFLLYIVKVLNKKGDARLLRLRSAQAPAGMTSLGLK